MRVEFLGTGGAVIVPRPLCSCGICVQARERGVPYARSGPSVFVHGPDVLIGTPEEIKGGKRLLIAPDEINGWVPLDWLRGGGSRNSTGRCFRVSSYYGRASHT